MSLSLCTRTRVSSDDSRDPDSPVTPESREQCIESSTLRSSTDSLLEDPGGGDCESLPFGDKKCFVFFCRHGGGSPDWVRTRDMVAGLPLR